MDLVIPQFGEMMEQGKQTASGAVKTAVSDVANSVQSQIGLGNEKNIPAQTNSQPQMQNQSSNSEPAVTGMQDLTMQSEQTQEAVRDYYSPTAQVVASGANPRTQEEYDTQQKLLDIRKKLHDEVYYNPLIAYENKQNERPQDIAEKEEEQKKMMELEQKNKDDRDIPIALKRAQMSTEHRDQGGAG